MRVDTSKQASLAERIHESHISASLLDGQLYEAVIAACGELRAADGDDEIHTDYYDNSIEVWGVGAVEIDEVVGKLKGLGFDRVWLHQHAERGDCRCPCR